MVDMACVQRAKAGQLTDGLATEASGFAIAPIATGGARLTRTGRALTAAEGAALWQALQHEVFMAGGLASGHSGMYSIYKCPDVGDGSCIKFAQWVCQVGVEVLAQRIAATVEKLGLADAELGVETTFEEARGPSCKLGAACLPAQHYSTKGTYDPKGARHGGADGRGACVDDGDCEGHDSNGCAAWYLRGGGEASVYIMRSTPAWCGCIHERCSWFSQ